MNPRSRLWFCTAIRDLREGLPVTQASPARANWTTSRARDNHRQSSPAKNIFRTCFWLHRSRPVQPGSERVFLFPHAGTRSTDSKRPVVAAICSGSPTPFWNSRLRSSAKKSQQGRRRDSHRCSGDYNRSDCRQEDYRGMGQLGSVRDAEADRSLREPKPLS